MAKQTYQLLARLADRGMGETYLARTGDGSAARLVALERLPKARAADAEVVREFLESARAGAQLAHPNVVQILDAGRLGSSYFVATEYVDGELLRSIIEHARAQGRLQVPLRAVLTIAAGIATALHFAHERKPGDGQPGILHGNLTPASVIISRDGIVKLVDFGTRGGPLAYRSPEQLHGGAVDRRSDLFSLGVVLYELLTRERLYVRGNDDETRAAIESEVAPSPSHSRMDVPEELDAVIAKLLAKQADRRYADADDLLVDIEALATKLGFPISTSDLSRVMRVWFGSKPGLATLETQAIVESDELVADGANEEVDRALERVPGLSVAMFESESAEERRAANPTPPPVDVGTPVESFQEIRDRILGARTKTDSKGPNPRAQAYTHVPTPASESRTTLQGISPTAITDVISRVTQAASAAGAATRQAVSASTGAGDAATVGGDAASTSDAARTADAADHETPAAPVVDKLAEAPPMAAVVATEAEPSLSSGINGFAKKPGLEAAQAMAVAEAAEREASGATAAPASESTRTANTTDAPATRKSKDSDALATRKSKGTDAPATPKGDASPETVAHKEPSTKLALPRTQSTEWFERGEREAKEAHAAAAAAAARALAKGHHDDHDHDHAVSGARTGGGAKRTHGMLYPVLGLAAVALVVIALVKIATREPASKVGRHDAKALATAPLDAADTQLAGSSQAATQVAGSADIGSAAGSAGSAPVAAVAIDAAVVAPKPDAAEKVATVVGAGVDPTKSTKADTTKTVKPDTRKSDTTRSDSTKALKSDVKKADEAQTIEQMFEKGSFAKANQACATNTRFNPSRLEVCALAACNVKDSALANRWLHAIERASRDAVIAKCKDLGLDLTAP